jgi:hypothetical protein
MIQGVYVIGLIILLIAIYFIVPEMTISSAFEATSGSESGSATKEGFINVPQPVEIPAVKDIKSSEGPSLPSAPFYGVSEDRPLPPIDPENEVASALRMRRLLERSEGFFLSDYKTLEDKVEFLEPVTNAKALLPRLREEIHFLDANPGMPPTLTTKKIMEGEATLSFLERAARQVTLNEIEGYTNFGSIAKKGLERKEGFVNGGNKQPRTRATVKDLVNFNLRAWSEMQRLGASGTTDPIINARINAIKKIRDSMQRIIDDVKYKKITEADIPIFKEDLERAFPILADTTKPLPKLLAASQLPPELANILPPGSNPNEKDIQKLISTYINNILQSTSFSMKLKVDYISPNEVRLEEAKAKANAKANANVNTTPNQESINFSTIKPGPKMNLTFSDSNGNPVNEVNVNANDPTSQSQQAKYNPSLDWKGRTKQMCEQIRRRGLDPQDFGCLKESDEVSPTYSWRGHAKMVCSRLGSTPDPALPQTCGCPPANWGGWNSDYNLD